MENVWSIGKSKLPPPPGEILNEAVAAVLEGERQTAQLASGYTLRVKPDRRRAQLPIPAGLDRRRTP
jgi:hypothetical protein